MKWISILALVALSGCSYLDPLSDKIQDGVDRYCEEPASVRRTIRETVNPTPDGNTIIVNCAGD